MGWTFVRQTRDQLIRELLAPQASERACCEVIDHTLDGDVLWTVVRVTARHAVLHPRPRSLPHQPDRAGAVVESPRNGGRGERTVGETFV